MFMNFYIEEPDETGYVSVPISFVWFEYGDFNISQELHIQFDETPGDNYFVPIHKDGRVRLPRPYHKAKITSVCFTPNPLGDLKPKLIEQIKKNWRSPNK